MNGESPKEFSDRFIDEFLKDMADLQCLRPTHEPRVTDHIKQIIDMIAHIMSNGCAYAVDGDVYFSVDKFPNYGKLSKRNIEEDNRAGERVAVNESKRNPFDFTLWKAAKEGEPHWDSPWGPGRPGWHIECSAMSAHILTHSFDIHGGGMDLIFPHHENEIAQSCASASCSKTQVKYWMHNGFVTIDDQKMSKSLGNFFTIQDVTKRYHPLALRHFLLGTHYRLPINFSDSPIEIASEAVFYIYQTLQDFEDALSALKQEGESSKMGSKSQAAQESIEKIKKCTSDLHNDFENKMGDDLQTPPVINGALIEALRFMNNYVTTLKQQRQHQLSTIDSLVDLREKVRKVLDLLGLLSSSSYTEVLQQLKDKALIRAKLSEVDILHSIEERTLARKKKEFSKSDEIRSNLASKGIALMDVLKQTIWRICVPVVKQAQQHEVPLQHVKKDPQHPKIVAQIKDHRLKGKLVVD